MKGTIVAVLALGALALSIVPAPAQTSGLEIDTTLTAKARNGRLVGRVVAPLGLTGVTERPCESNRQVVAFVKTKSGKFKKFATVRASSEGKWKVRPPKKRGVYKFKAPAKNFSFSTEYAVLISGKCKPASLKGKLRRGRFRITSRS